MRVMTFVGKNVTVRGPEILSRHMLGCHQQAHGQWRSETSQDDTSRSCTVLTATMLSLMCKALALSIDESTEVTQTAILNKKLPMASVMDQTSPRPKATVNKQPSGANRHNEKFH